MHERKTQILLGVATFFFLAGFLEYGPLRAVKEHGVTLTIEALVIVVALFVWFLLDSRERGYSPSWLLHVFMAALSVFAFPYYLIRSRGWRHGCKAMALAILAFGGTMALYRSGAWLSSFFT